jgi:hypothetical protein
LPASPDDAAPELLPELPPDAPLELLVEVLPELLPDVPLAPDVDVPLVPLEELPVDLLELPPSLQAAKSAATPVATTTSAVVKLGFGLRIGATIAGAHRCLEVRVERPVVGFRIYRAIYSIDDAKERVVGLAVGHRREIYR